MGSITAVDEKTGRKFYLDDPDDLQPGEKVVFLLNLHGGGSVGMWQHAVLPGLPSTRNSTGWSSRRRRPRRRSPRGGGSREADDEHLRNIVDYVFEKYGQGNIKSFWLVGHSQGGMTSNRLLGTDFFKERVDGWLSLSGGRIGPIELAAQLRPARPADAAAAAGG